MAPLILSLMLSLGAAPQHDQEGDLRISIARVETAETKSNNHEFAITLENQGDQDFVIVLGFMLGNGKKMFPMAVALVLTGPNGRKSTLHYRGPSRIGGRIDAYLVALRSHDSYVLRVRLAQFRSPYTGEGRTPPFTDDERDPKLPPGTYSVQATFEGQAAQSSNTGTEGNRLLALWTGTATSNELRFSVP